MCKFGVNPQALIWTISWVSGAGMLSFRASVSGLFVVKRVAIFLKQSQHDLRSKTTTVFLFSSTEAFFIS